MRAQSIRLGTFLLVGLMVPLLDGCVAASDENQPLSSIPIRDRLSARTLSGSENGNGFLLRLERNGVARVNGATAEFGHWRATENGLCLTWHDGAERCAPVIQLGFARYGVGNMELNTQKTFDHWPMAAPGNGERHWDFGVPPP
jgi:hypothetical protein